MGLTVPTQRATPPPAIVGGAIAARRPVRGWYHRCRRATADYAIMIAMLAIIMATSTCW
jgi:hypothetical protein